MVRNLDTAAEGVGFFASICDAPPDTNQYDVAVKALEYLRERLTTANSKEVLLAWDQAQCSYGPDCLWYTKNLA